MIESFDVHTLQVGKLRLRKTTTLNPKRVIAVQIERILPAGEPVRLEVNWEGGGPGFRAGVSRDLLTKAIQSKVKKRYATPRVSKFVLLAHSIDTLVPADDPKVSASRCILESLEHPFDDAWFIYLYAEKESLAHSSISGQSINSPADRTRNGLWLAAVPRSRSC